MFAEHSAQGSQESQRGPADRVGDISRPLVETSNDRRRVHVLLEWFGYECLLSALHSTGQGGENHGIPPDGKHR
ncbi:hypothetical protein STPH1_7223 [Streptomyces sp. OM5714]|nr:hypothetical protein STPH1_7223 [Streptomyces sp. OM5714]